VSSNTELAKASPSSEILDLVIDNTDAEPASDDPLENLTERQQQVAQWLATSIEPGDEAYVSRAAFARSLGISPSRVTAIAEVPKVREAARTLARTYLQHDAVPRIMSNVLAKAEKDAAFGLKVLDFLHRLGIDPVIGTPADLTKDRDTVVLSVPGNFDAIVRARRVE
jgi:hypothetical protein